MILDGATYEVDIVHVADRHHKGGKLKPLNVARFEYYRGALSVEELETIAGMAGGV